MESKQKLVLIDGNSILYRAFFALPLLSNDKGVYTNAVFGFTKMLLKVLEDENPTHVLVAFDAGKTTFRHKTYKEYKGGRQKTPPELSEQFNLVRELLDESSVKHYELDQYEADDIIGTLANKASQQNIDVQVITGDKDMLQLVSDNVNVQITKKGLSEIDVYTPEFLRETFTLDPDQIIDMKALMGDNSDNIPGVAGVGEKTAIKLLNQFKSLDGIYEQLDDVSGKKLKEKLKDNKELAYMSQQLVTINQTSPVEVTLDDLAYNGYEPQSLQQFFKKVGFKSLLDQVGEEGDDQDPKEELESIEVHHVKDVRDITLNSPCSLVVEMIEENYHTAPILGFGITVDQSTHYFIPEDIALASDVFKNWLQDPKQIKWTFDAKKLTVALLRHGIRIKGIGFDALLASYLTNPSETNHDIPAMSQRLGYSNVLFDEEVYGKGKKRQIPEVDQLAEHIVRKSKALYTLKDQIEVELNDNEQGELLYELELPLSVILGEMEATGVSVDQDQLEKMKKDLKVRLEEIEAKIYDLAGEEFNLNSPKQLGPILFEKLELPVIKKTKTGYSTSADILEKLKDKHPIIPEILTYRQLGKLQSTYIEGLLKVIHDDGKIHTMFNQALTQTGRLSSTEPNLQNIPIRLEEGKKIRKAFIPSEEDWVIFAADYSQIELRVLAHIAKDEKLLAAFKDQRDIHTQTAMDVFHVDAEEVNDLMRRQAKAVNFGIVYGISDYGLSQNLNISRKEAKAFIDRYFDSYPGVKEYMDDIVHQAKQDGYVTTLMQRRRYLPEITSRNFNQRSFAERTAMNTPIQGSAADIIKKAMIDLDHYLKEHQFKARLLLQVHDELILEAPQEELEQLKEVVPEIMSNTVELSVPLDVDYAYGHTWFDAK
ncbi:DNA polymerase I [Pelagirhabdus alkalitolerans]|uniref:DNA polymerase I n=1 Tax=Pelagirhabdus alkalitolerans TaxID=1612202 RepID=A0A1G6HKA4_9BACI|nr:DNA polymerase I [Pelagirhabdus alkalitolerans]SDB94690.1 DNA polymerase I [Pelagirhabdus alkalitolerans]